MLKQRIITAIILAPLAISAIFFLPLPWFAAFILLVLTIGAWEWGPLMGFTNVPLRVLFALTNVFFIGALWHFVPLEHLWLNATDIDNIAVKLLWLSIFWWMLSALLTFLYPKFTSIWGAHRSIRGVFGWLTLIPTWMAFVVLRSHEYADNPLHGANLLMFLFLLVWGADVGAYFVGKAFGRHKLLPRVSPGKTMEGFIGGMVTAVIAVWLVGFLLEWSQHQFLLASLMAVIISTISVLGDLNESMFKRQAGIKDSGTILPGHGGILDRIDSLTATAPVFALCYVAYGW